MKSLLRLACPVVLTVLACWQTSAIHGHPQRGVDDAQILFSYSSNLAAGKGLVYACNPERVEGATSLLWTLVCSVPFRLGLDETGVLVISVVILCLTQVLLIAIIRRSAAARQMPSWPFQFAYLVAVLSSPAYFSWMSITLMDTCLWGLLVVLMTYVAVFPPRSRIGTAAAAIPFFLAPLSRPEAAVVAPALIALAWLSCGDRREGRWRLVLGLAAAFMASVVGVTLFRLSYFGYPLPNTYYAKVSPSLAYNLTEGVGYLAGFVLNSGPIVVAAAFFLLWCAGDLVGRLLRRPRTGGVPVLRAGVAAWRIAALAAMVLLVTPVLTGGDHFVGYRFYQPAYPVMVLAVVLFLAARLPHGVLERLTSSELLKRRLALAVLLAGLVYWTYSDASKPSWLDAEVSEHKVIKDQFGTADAGMQKGNRLRALFSGLPGWPTLGVTAAGGIARTYPGGIVDLLGLNTLEIAHAPGKRRGFKNHAAFQREMFFRLPKIDMLLAAPPVPPLTKNFASAALKGLMDDPRFVGAWRYGTLSLSGAGAGGFEAFYSAEFIDSLAATGRYRFRETMRWSQKWVPVDSAREHLP